MNTLYTNLFSLILSGIHQKTGMSRILISTFKKPEGIRIDFWIEITGNLDETGDGAEVSTFKSSMPLKSEKDLHRDRGSLFRFGNWAVSLHLNVLDDNYRTI